MLKAVLCTFMKYVFCLPSSVVSMRHVSLNELIPCGAMETNSVPSGSSVMISSALVSRVESSVRPNWQVKAYNQLPSSSSSPNWVN